MRPPVALGPAYYAPAARRGAWADWWVLMHPPYTLWHLAYVAIGASIGPTFDGGRLAATLVAFFLAVGVAAHALDELHDRPLGTAIASRALATVSAVALGGAALLGLAGVQRVGAGLVVFVVVGVALTSAYNLELAGGRLHNDVVFAAAWGSFPVLTAAYAQAGTIRPVAFVAALAAFFLSCAQRALSTPARALRRRTFAVEGTVTALDGDRSALTVERLLRPLEVALRAMTWGIVTLAVALVAARLLDR